MTKNDTWEELPALDAGPGGCGTCQTKGVHLHADAWLAVGFGACTATRDGECFYDQQEWEFEHRHEREGDDSEDPPTLAWLEEQAAAAPDHDWRVHYFAPMYEAHYQRHRDGTWVLYQRGEGFA